jgi:type IV secretion system protein TrbL
MIRLPLGRVPRRSLVLTGALCLLAVAAVGIASAQAPAVSPQEAPVLDGIRDTYRNAARGWLPRLVPVAQRLFVVLAGIEFALSGAVWALKRESLDEVAGKFLLKFTLVAFLLALITSFQYWIPPLVNGFAAAGERAIGRTTTVNPSEVIDIGRENSMLIMRSLHMSTMLQDPAMAMYAALSAFILALAFMAVAAQLTLVMIESYIVLGAGVLFLGFSAFRGTASFAENLIAYALHVGVKIFFLYLIVGIGTELARSWPPLIQSSDFFGPVSPLFQVVGGALIFAVLSIAVPNTVAARLATRPSIGIAHALKALS